MPELPEVETVRRLLEPCLRGRLIEKVTVLRQVIAHPGAEEFIRRVTGRRFDIMKRRGKFLGFLLDDGQKMVLHLRMTGCLLIEPAGVPAEKHTHVVFSLDDGRELRFSDMRRFGRFWLFAPGEADSSGAEKLGPEPSDPALTGDYLRAKCGKSSRAVKECLLDQSVVAGIGNIYSDEILFAARLMPSCPASRLTRRSWQQLARLIGERISYFTEKNKISLEDYLRSKGGDYRNTPYLQVYGHAGQPCPVCGTQLRRTVIGGRSSVYCPHCQKLPRTKKTQ
jgi:formamidopyrimidine-DNA glycosylase